MPRPPWSGRTILISAVQLEDQLREGRRSVLDLAPLAAATGASGVEYRDVYWRDKPSQLADARRQLGERGLIATYTTLTPLCHADPRMQERLLEDIEDARELGALLLRVNLGTPPEDGLDGRGARAAARVAIEHARRHGVLLSLENNGRPPDHRLEDIQWAVRHFDSATLGTNLDFANYIFTDQDPLAAVRALGRWINYVHLKDGRRTPAGWRGTYLGNGELPLGEILAAIEAIGRPVPMCFEFPGEGDPEAAIRSSFAWLKEWNRKDRTDPTDRSDPRGGRGD